MTHGAMFANNPFWDLIEEIRADLHHEWGKVRTFHNALGTLSVEYGIEDGQQYADVALMLPDNVYAVIDSDTYGQLYAIRIFRDDDRG